jgi:hypothetical protein
VNLVGFFATNEINYYKKREQTYKATTNKQRDFLLCESCFWCASCIDSEQKHMTRCPSCNDFRLNYLPITNNEIYKLDEEEKQNSR